MTIDKVNKSNNQLDDTYGYTQLFASGFPKKDEEYRFLNLKKLIAESKTFTTSDNEDIDKHNLEELLKDCSSAIRIVVINGLLSKDYSTTLPKGLTIVPFEQDTTHASYLATFEKQITKSEKSIDPFENINSLNHSKGLFIKVDANIVIEDTVEIIFISQGNSKNTVNHYRNLLIVEKGAQVQLIEHYKNSGLHFNLNNVVNQAIVAENANLIWNKFQNDCINNQHIDNTSIVQQQNSVSQVNTFSFGSMLIRNNLKFIQQGENINSIMNGISLSNGTQQIDHHTVVYHNFPNCESYQSYKGLFNQQSHGVFNGKILVDKNAQKINAYQQNNNILLSKEARIDTKPQLEIFADDVKCSHGCTVGQLDLDALFYLCSRGIPKASAKRILLHAFIAETITTIADNKLKERIEKIVTEKLEIAE